MDNVFAGQTGDVGAGAANVFSLDQGGSLALLRQGPGEVFSCFAAAEHENIILIRLDVWIFHGFNHQFVG